MTSFLAGREPMESMRPAESPRRLWGGLQLVALLGVTCAFVALVAAAALVSLLVQFSAFSR